LKVEQIVKKREVERTTEKNFEEPKVKTVNFFEELMLLFTLVDGN